MRELTESKDTYVWRHNGWVVIGKHMSKFIRFFVLITIVLIVVVAIGAATPRPTAAVDGKTLFRQYCAVCHGLDGKGAGPAVSALKQAPTDLTAINRQHNGRFPDDKILRILNGAEPIASHGTQEMPIWGPVFYGMSNNLSLGQLRVHALVSYLEQIQAK